MGRPHWMKSGMHMAIAPAAAEPNPLVESEVLSISDLSVPVDDGSTLVAELGLSPSVVPCSAALVVTDLAMGSVLAACVVVSSCVVDADVSFKPPPQEQHMSMAVKSESS